MASRHSHAPPSRRTFLGTLAATTAAALAPDPLAARHRIKDISLHAATPFSMRYAPPLGMFEGNAGKDPLDQIRFMADQGFRAMFDNGLMNRPVAEQEAIAAETARRGMEIGPFVTYADFSVTSFVNRDPAVRDMMKDKLTTAIETGKRTNVRTTLVVPGRYDQRMDWDYQTANVVENLKWCAGICEHAGS